MSALSTSSAETNLKSSSTSFNVGKMVHPLELSQRPSHGSLRSNGLLGDAHKNLSPARLRAIWSRIRRRSTLHAPRLSRSTLHKVAPYYVPRDPLATAPTTLHGARSLTIDQRLTRESRQRRPTIDELLSRQWHHPPQAELPRQPPQRRSDSPSAHRPRDSSESALSDATGSGPLWVSSRGTGADIAYPRHAPMTLDAPSGMAVAAVAVAAALATGGAHSAVLRVRQWPVPKSLRRSVSAPEWLERWVAASCA